HSPAVHPRTFGRDGYVRRSNIGYFRFGLHSAYFNSAKARIEKIAQACRAGTYYPTSYTILQLVPNALMAFFRTDANNFHCVVMLYEPVRHDRTNLRAWLYPMPRRGHSSWMRSLSDRVRTAVISRYVSTVAREDSVVCERLQAVAHQIGRAPL